MNYEDRVTKSYIEDVLAGKCRIVTGSYQGNDTDNRFISLGFTPKLVLVVARTVYMTTTTEWPYYGLKLAENGFYVSYNNNNGTNTKMTAQNYYYAAFA